MALLLGVFGVVAFLCCNSVAVYRTLALLTWPPASLTCAALPPSRQVRNKIKMFAQQKVTLPPGRQKIIILDEADRWGRTKHMRAPESMLEADWRQTAWHFTHGSCNADTEGTIPCSIAPAPRRPYPRRSPPRPGPQHDVGGAAGAAAHHGDLQLYHALCAGLQPVLQDH